MHETHCPVDIDPTDNSHSLPYSDSFIASDTISGRQAHYYRTSTTVESAQPNLRLMMVPGFGEGHQGYRRASQMLTLEGRDVYTYENERCSEVAIDPLAYEDGTLGLIVDDTPDEKLSFVGRSKGGIIAARRLVQMVKDRRQDEIGAVVLEAPGGLIGPDSESRLIARAGQEIRDNTRNTPNSALGRKALAQTGIYVARNAWLARRETRAIARADITRDIDYLLDNNVPVGVVAGERDRIFPLNRMNKSIEYLKQNGLLFTSLEGIGHLEFANSTVINAILGQLAILESSKPNNPSAHSRRLQLAQAS